MKTRVQKWGNSLAVRIPKSFAEEIGLAGNSPAEMSLEEGAIVVRPDKDGSWDLESLLAGVTGENIHPPRETESAAADATDDEDESKRDDR